jgi:hypothetical protein
MSLNNPPNGDDVVIQLYQWKEKDVSVTEVSGSETTFATSLVIASDIPVMSGLDTVPTGDRFTEDTSERYTYYEYDTGWAKTTGKLAGYEVKVYFRKNGIDYMVDGSTYTVGKGATYWEIEFTNAPTTAVADEVIISYPYDDKVVPVDYCLKDFNPKPTGGDYETIQCLGGKTWKRKQPLGLTEISLTLNKMGNSLFAAMMGSATRDTDTFTGKTVVNSTGGNKVVNRAVKIKVEDPDDSTNYIIGIYRNAGLTSYDPKGGVDANYEESVTLKCEPENTTEIEVY